MQCILVCWLLLEQLHVKEVWLMLKWHRMYQPVWIYLVTKMRSISRLTAVNQQIRLMLLLCTSIIYGLCLYDFNSSIHGVSWLSGQAHQTCVLSFESLECWFKSRSWPWCLCPCLLASLLPGVKARTCEGIEMDVVCPQSILGFLDLPSFRICDCSFIAAWLS